MVVHVLVCKFDTLASSEVRVVKKKGSRSLSLFLQRHVVPHGKRLSDTVQGALPSSVSQERRRNFMFGLFEKYIWIGVPAP